MCSSKSQKYISGRELTQKWSKRWERKLITKREIEADARKDSLGLDIVLYKLIEAFVLIAIGAKKDRPIIIDDTWDNPEDHILEIEMYRFDREEVERLENEDLGLILEYMIDSKLINDAHIPPELDPQEIINILNKRLENITTISNRAGLSSREKAYLKKKQDDIEDDIKRERNRLKKQRPVKKNLRPNQIAKIECRKVAAKLWKKYPEMTIADMIMRPEIDEACADNPYAEKTIRNWIKDLCPNRSPGRRRRKNIS